MGQIYTSVENIANISVNILYILDREEPARSIILHIWPCSGPASRYIDLQRKQTKCTNRGRPSHELSAVLRVWQPCICVVAVDESWFSARIVRTQEACIQKGHALHRGGGLVELQRYEAAVFCKRTEKKVVG